MRATRFVLVTAFVALGAAGLSARQTPPPASQPPTRPPAGQQTPPPLPTAPKPAATPTPAATPVPFPADSKIAFINMQYIVSESKLGKAGTAQMKTLTDKQQADLAEKNNAIRALQQKIQTQSALVTAAAQAQMTSELEKLQRDLQYAQNEAQAQADELNQKLLSDFQEKVLPIVDAIAKEKGLYAVWSVQDAGVAYVQPGLDLSAEVIKRLDVKYPGK
ncbi:MAG TPA: OmpH family outer membrane protein [Vicinamibacterales bacterium]|nr:OmpH family outer membrane protein [Vicinamibacterales bacterium]